MKDLKKLKRVPHADIISWANGFEPDSPVIARRKKLQPSVVCSDAESEMPICAPKGNKQKVAVHLAKPAIGEE